ncbi:hypothetical protein [Haloarchaeobius amylolyticus]|uniref:hypothetical protein n=1 Tax=Haloarchaeobius amylolyticus TaxID=1198296 RepID=UPI00226DA933|nr:hypothetical protein [Haloarchaeobius amylolyticus]
MDSDRRSLYTESVWTDTDDDQGDFFHQFCDLDPRKTAEPPFLISFSETSRFGRLVGQVLAYGLQHTPLIVLSVASVLLIMGEFSDSVEGLSAFIEFSPGFPLLFFGLELGIWLGILLLVGVIVSSLGDIGEEESTGAEEVSRVISMVTVYGGGVALAAGTVFSLYRVYTVPIEDLSANVVYASGFLFMLYVTGPLVYDGMRRTESLFRRLHQTHLIPTNGIYPALEPDGSIPDTEEAEAALDDPVFRSYQRYYRQLIRTLNSHVKGIPTALLISLLFVAQFCLIWLHGAGPFMLGEYGDALGISPVALIALLVTLAVDVLIVIVAVQFIVLVWAFHRLLSGVTYAEWLEMDDAPSPPPLRYYPAHEDKAGGFKDFGRFATRVNVLLVIAGVYLMYRLQVQGIRDPLRVSSEVTTTATASVDGLVWALSYTLPILVYIAVISIWVYFSFWQIHRRMVLEKSKQLRKEREERDDGRLDRDLEQYERFDSAPEWPINDRLLVTIVSLDVISVALALVSIL